MTRRWVVGVDGSDAAVDALGWAVSHAGDRDARVTALSAYHVPAIMAMFTAKRGFGVDELGIAATAGHDIDVAIERLADVDERVTIESSVVEGQPGQVLVDASAGADLLVVGRSGTGGFRHLLGSVSRTCATHASSPVVVVPSGRRDEATNSIVVGFDGSEQASRAIEWALEFAGEQAPVGVVAAVEAAPWLDPGLTRQRFPDEVREQEELLTAAIDRVDPDRRAARSIVLDNPRRALAEATVDADLVVVGARGHGRIAAELLGSVTTWLLHDAVGPVAVVP